jgi:hypothetical protein
MLVNANAKKAIVNKRKLNMIIMPDLFLLILKNLKEKYAIRRLTKKDTAYTMAL